MVAQQLEILKVSIQEKCKNNSGRLDAFAKSSKEQFVSTDDVAHMRSDIRTLRENYIDLSGKVDIHVNQLTGRIARL